MILFRSLLITALIILPTICYAKAGPSIPVPLVSAEEAIRLAREAFANRTLNTGNQDYFREFILQSVEYKTEQQKNSGNWYWELRFVHPRDNDCKWVYKVNNNKEVKLLYTTK